MDEWIGWMGYSVRGDSVMVCAGSFHRRPEQELSVSTPCGNFLGQIPVTTS
jgi:hypothetical protein